MAKEYKTINGVEFEVIRAPHAAKQMMLLHKMAFSGKDLFSYYEKPSEIKQVIYNDWREWCIKTREVYNFEVISGNTFKFTIAMLYEQFAGNERGYIRITREHNKLYLAEW